MDSETRQLYYDYWIEEIDDIIRTTFWDVNDEILFKFFRMHAHTIADYTIAEKEKSENKTVEQLARGMQTLKALSGIEQAYSALFSRFISEHPDYENDNLLHQHLQFRIAFQDRLMDYEGLSLEQKVITYRSIKTILEKDIIQKDDKGYEEYLQPQIKHINLQLEECNYLIAERQKTVDNLTNTTPYPASIYLVKSTNFSEKALAEIAEYLFYKQIIRDKNAFKHFLSSYNVMVAVNKSRIVYYVEIMKHLRKKGFFSLSSTNKYLVHITTHILDFSISLNKSKPSQYISNLERKQPIDRDKLKEMLTAIDEKLR